MSTCNSVWKRDEIRIKGEKDTVERKGQCLDRMCVRNSFRGDGKGRAVCASRPFAVGRTTKSKEGRKGQGGKGRKKSINHLDVPLMCVYMGCQHRNVDKK